MQARVCGTSRTKDAQEARLIAGLRGGKKRKKKKTEKERNSRARSCVFVYACEKLCRGNNVVPRVKTGTLYILG